MNIKLINIKDVKHSRVPTIYSGVIRETCHSLPLTLADESQPVK